MQNLIAKHRNDTVYLKRGFKPTTFKIGFTELCYLMRGDEQRDGQ